MPQVLLRAKPRLKRLSICGLGGMHKLEDNLVQLDDRCVIDSMQMKFDDGFIGRRNDRPLQNYFQRIVDITHLRHLSLICCKTVEYHHAAVFVLRLCCKTLQRLVIDPRYTCKL